MVSEVTPYLQRFVKTLERHELKPEYALEIHHGRRFILPASAGASTTPAREHSPEGEGIQTNME